MSSPVSRGFRHLRRPPADQEGQVPPGQYVTQGFPVLSAGPTPHTPLPEWTFSIRQGGDTLKSWTWEEFQALPADAVTVDIHCVPRWSKLGTAWRGVSVDTLLAQVEHDARYVLAFCDGGYTSNLPVKDVTGGQARVVFEYDGRPLQAEHGGPARLLVPHLYFWKSAKWVRGPRTARPRHAGFPGELRLPHLRRSMAGTAVRGRLTWQVARVSWVTTETDAVRTIGLDVPDWRGHRAGQHLDVRLTAEDGYTAERSYSIAAAGGEPVAITVERLEDGEVSPYLTGELRAGDELELGGPIGRWFVWDTSDGGPLLVVAGGSRVAPLRAMLRHRQRSGSDVPIRLLYSSRTLADVIYHHELDQYRDGVQVSYTLTRSQPPGWTGYSGRVDGAMLAEIAWPAGQQPLAFVCGPTRFVETVAEELVALGYPPSRVKTERFGGT